MKKYKTPNGQIVEESVLRSKYGDKFDSFVQSGMLVPVDDQVDQQQQSSAKYKTPNGKVVEESVLRSKYGDKFDQLVESGMLEPQGGPVKKKESGTELGSLAGQSAFISQSESPEQTDEPIDGPDIASAGAKKLASSAGYGPDKRIVNVDGNNLEISASQLPSGYEKNGRGLQQFIQDQTVSLLGASPEAEQLAKTNLQIASLRTIAQSKTDLSLPIKRDIEEASSLLGKNVVVDETSLKELEEAKKQFLIADKKEFESNPDNYWIDGKTGQKRITKPYKAPDTSKYDSLIEKFGNAIVPEADYTSMSQVMSADMRNDLDKFLGGPVGKIINSQARTKAELLDENFYTGLAQLKMVDDGRASMIMSRISKGQTLSSSIVAELTAKGASIRDAKNAQRLINGEYGEGADAVAKFVDKAQKISTSAEKNFWSRDDLVDQTVGSAISEYHASKNRDLAAKGMNLLFGEWQVTDKEIDEVPASWYQSFGLDPARPEFAKSIQRLKDREGFLPFQNAIKKDGLTREILKGSANALSGTGRFFQNIGVGANERRLQSELDPISKYHQERTDYFDKHYGKLADAFNGFGQFATQYALMEAGVGIFKGLGTIAGGVEGAYLFRAPASADFIRGGSRAGNFIIDKASVMSQLMVPYVMSYDDYFKRGLQQTDNVGAARLYGATMASVEALSERIFGNLEFGREVIKNLKKGAISMDKIASVFNKGLSDKAVQAELRVTIKDAFQKAIKGVAGLGQEAFEEVPVAAANFVMDSLINPTAMDDRDMVGEMKDAFMSGLVSFSIPSLLGIGSQIRGLNVFANNTTAADALMVATANRNDVIDAIYNLGEDGVFSQEEVNQKIQMLNTASSVVRSMPNFYMDQTPMSEADRVQYMATSVREKYLAEQVKDLEKDDPERMIAEAEIQKLKQQRADILMKALPTQQAPGQQQEKGDMRILQGEEATEVPTAARVSRPEGAPKVRAKSPGVMSDDEDRNLLEELLTSERTGEFEKGESLQYFVDKAAEDPIAAEERWGVETTKKLIDRASDDKLLKAGMAAAKRSKEGMGNAVAERIESILEEREKRYQEDEDAKVGSQTAETTTPTAPQAENPPTDGATPTAEAVGKPSSKSLIEKKQKSIQEVEEQRDAELKKFGKPDIKIPFLSSQEMISANDPVALKMKQDELKDKYKEIKKAMDCLWT